MNIIINSWNFKDSSILLIGANHGNFFSIQTPSLTSFAKAYCGAKMTLYTMFVVNETVIVIEND